LFQKSLDLILPFCLDNDSREWVKANLRIPQNLNENYLKNIMVDFYQHIDRGGNYIIVINSFFSESNVGKSFLALFLLEQMIKLTDFSYVLFPDFASFLNSKNKKESCIYLIDDTTFSEIGVGSKRIKEQFNEFVGITARVKKMCFIFTTTFPFEKFRYLLNVKKYIAVIGYNEEILKSASYVFTKLLGETFLLIGGLPSEKIIHEYLVMKNDYTNSFLSNSQNQNISEILKQVDFDIFKRLNKKQSLAFLSLDFGHLTNKERDNICDLIHLVNNGILDKKKVLNLKE